MGRPKGSQNGVLKIRHSVCTHCGTEFTYQRKNVGRPRAVCDDCSKIQSAKWEAKRVRFRSIPTDEPTRTVAQMRQEGKLTPSERTWLKVQISKRRKAIALKTDRLGRVLGL